MLIFPMILLKLNNFLHFFIQETKKKLKKEICIYIEEMIYFVKRQPFAT